MSMLSVHELTHPSYTPPPTIDLVTINTRLDVVELFLK